MIATKEKKITTALPLRCHIKLLPHHIIWSPPCHIYDRCYVTYRIITT